MKKAYCEETGKTHYQQVFPLLLHALYDHDVLVEEAIFEWEKEAKEEKKSKPFLKLVFSEKNDSHFATVPTVLCLVENRPR